MTFWAKLLTIVIFVLSIAFAAMSAVVFAKREDYRDQLRRMTALKESNEQAAKETEKTLKAQRDDAIAASGKAVANLNSLQQLFNQQHDQLEQKRLDVNEWQSRFNKMQAESLSNASLAKTLDDDYKEVKAANKELEKVRDDYFTQLTGERNRANKLEKEKADLQKEFDTATASLKDARDTIKLDEDTFATLARHNIEAQRIIAGLTKLPDIKDAYGNTPKVAFVDPSSNSVVLNVGSNVGVKKNYEFTIFRDSQFIAKANVYSVDAEFSAAQIVLTNTKHLPIQRGDNAATRLVGQIGQ